MNWLRKLFEDEHGNPDDARVSAFLLVVGFIGSSLWSVYSGHEFKPQDWGIGAGALAAGIGGWFGFRKEN